MAGGSPTSSNVLPNSWRKEMWPPSSPDCNPMAYYVWGHVIQQQTGPPRREREKEREGGRERERESVSDR